ncbi:MAG: hypothetical protein ACJAXI_003044 [Crocinitomicaceae bacterium]
MPSSKQSFQLIRGKKELDSSFFKISFSPTKSENMKALRAGVLKAQFNYSIRTDTASIDATALNMIDQTNFNSLLHIGDWTESMFLLSKHVSRERDMPLASLLINQEKSVDLITAKLIELNLNNDLVEIIDSFKKLQSIYGAIKRKYKVLKPKVDKVNKTTTLGSKTVIRNTRKSFIQIENELNILRDKIHNHTDNQ